MVRGLIKALSRPYQGLIAPSGRAELASYCFGTGWNGPPANNSRGRHADAPFPIASPAAGPFLELVGDAEWKFNTTHPSLVTSVLCLHKKALPKEWGGLL